MREKTNTDLAWSNMKTKICLLKGEVKEATNTSIGNKATQNRLKRKQRDAKKEITT